MGLVTQPDNQNLAGMASLTAQIANWLSRWQPVMWFFDNVVDFVLLESIKGAILLQLSV